MPDQAILDEAYKRGLLPPDKRSAYEEAQRRGIIARTPTGESNLNLLNDPATAGAEIVSGAKRNAEARINLARQRLNAAMGRDQDVDYDTGLSFIDQSFLARMDNPEERRGYLEQKYGASGMGTDSRGVPYIIENGKKISAEGGGFLEGTAAWVTGNAPMLAGATGGAVVGGVVGAMGGAVVGKGIQETEKYAHGQLRKTPTQEATELAKQGAFAGAGEAGGRLVAGAAGRVSRGPLPKMLGGQTPESQAMTEMTLNKGGVPPIVSSLPSSRYLQRHMELAERIVGPAKGAEEKNFALVRNELKTMLEKSGLSPAQADDALVHLMDPTARISSTDLGRDIQASVKAHADSLQSAADSLASDANKILDQQLSHLDTLTRRYKPGDLGVDVAGGISQARADFGTAASKIYERVDRLVGDEPVVPTAFIKKQANDLLKSLPKTAQGEVALPNPQVVKAINDLVALPDKVSFSDAQQIRAQLGDMAEMRDLVPPNSKRQFGNLQDSVDVAFTIAAKDPAAAPAARMLATADKFYGEGIQKFKDRTINQLVKQAENGIPVDPERVAKLILVRGQSARVETIKKLLPAETWKRVAGADFNNMIEASKRIVDGKEVVSGKQLLAQIRGRGTILDIAYGPQGANTIRSYAHRLAARDGEIPAADLVMDNFSATMMRAEGATQAIDKFMSENFLAELAKPTFSPDAAFAWIVRPGQQAQLEQAIAHFGESSAIVQGIRQQAVKDLLSRTVIEVPTGTATTIDGGAIDRALSVYTRRQQDLLFPAGLADDMRLLAKEVKFLFPRDAGTQTMAGFSAGGQLQAPMWTRWYYQTVGGFWQWLLTRPTMVRALALGIKETGPVRAATRESMQAIFRAVALGSAPEQEGEPESQGSQP